MTRDVLELASSLGFLDELYDQYRAHARRRSMRAGTTCSMARATQRPRRRNGHGASGNGWTVGWARPGRRHRAGREVVREAPPQLARPRRRHDGADHGAGRRSAVWPLVNAYRSRGHFSANLDPLGLLETARIGELDPATWGFTDRDLDRVIEPTGVHGLPRATLRRAAGRTCGASTPSSVGARVHAHLVAGARGRGSPSAWRSQLMRPLPRRGPHADARAADQRRAVRAVLPHQVSRARSGSRSRASESLIPMLDLVLTHGARLGAIEAVLGMAHRGRLTTIEQILKRPARDMFAHFEDVEPEKAMGGGDVKYHLGFSTDRIDAERQRDARLARVQPEPPRGGRSGRRRPRARQADAATATSSTAASSASSSTATPRSPARASCPRRCSCRACPGYRTGGTVHVIVNNQVGFTASPAGAALDAVLHRRREDDRVPDLARQRRGPRRGRAASSRSRCEYRAQFSSDVVIDMYCYRKYGHNESDEPSFTQPLMYERDPSRRPSPVEVYGKRAASTRACCPPTRSRR